MGELLVLKADQEGKQLDMTRDYDRQIWSGLSWAVAEVRPQDMIPGSPVRITYTVTDPKHRSGVAKIRAFAVSN